MLFGVYSYIPSIPVSVRVVGVGRLSLDGWVYSLCLVGVVCS